jgi:hypothetical protein
MELAEKAPSKAIEKEAIQIAMRGLQIDRTVEALRGYLETT